MFNIRQMVSDWVAGFFQFRYRCRHCDTIDNASWLCSECCEQIVELQTQSLRLQRDVVILNRLDESLLEKLIVMDDEEIIGVVVPDSEEALSRLGVIVPSCHKKSN